MRSKAEVLSAFSPVGKMNPAQAQALLRLEVAFKEMALEVMDLVPESADRTVALRKLLESKMMCSQAISHDMGAAVQASYSEEPKQEKATHGKSKKD